MFTPRQHENIFLFSLRWLARGLTAFCIALLLLWMFGVGADITSLTWEEKGMFLLFPLGLVSGLILGWQEEIIGGTVVVVDVVSFYCVYRFILMETADQSLWILFFTVPGFLLLLHGLLSRQILQKNSGF